MERDYAKYYDNYVNKSIVTKDEFLSQIELFEKQAFRAEMSDSYSSTVSERASINKKAYEYLIHVSKSVVSQDILDTFSNIKTRAY